MNWYLLAVLAIPGLVMGLLSLMGLTHKIELYLWILLGIFASLVVARNVSDGWYWHTILIGISWGVLNAVMQCTFFETYSAHNPAALAGFGDKPTPIPIRYFFLVMGPIIGLVTGIVLTGLTLVMRKVAGS